MKCALIKILFSEQIFHFIVDVVNSICWCYSLGYCSQCYFYIGKVERVGQSLFAIDWHSFPGWSKGKLQNPADKSLSLVRFVCAKPLDFVNLGLSSLATEHLTLRRSGGVGGGDWGGHSLSLQELWRETLETKLPLQQLVPSFFCHRWRAQKLTSEESRLSGKQQHTILHFVLSLDLIISWSKQYAFSRQSSFFTLLKHHSEGCHKLQFTGNHFWELMVKVSKTIMRNNTKG